MQAWSDPNLRSKELAARRRALPRASDAEVAEWMAVYAIRCFETIPYQQHFKRMVLAEPGLRGRVLDIGSASFLPPSLYTIREIVEELEGVDPDPAIAHHPHLSRRWNSTFEEADLPDRAYDLVYSYNVVEHIVDARRFFEKVHRVLKPGAPFLALTPHATHPFCFASRLVQGLGAKRWVSRVRPEVNSYPAYYRLNTRRSVLRAIDGLGFASAQFHYLHAGWFVYFPRPLRWLPRAYDRLLARHFESTRLILAYRLLAN